MSDNPVVVSPDDPIEEAHALVLTAVIQYGYAREQRNVDASRTALRDFSNALEAFASAVRQAALEQEKEP